MNWKETMQPLSMEKKNVDYSQSGKTVEGATLPIILPVKTTDQRNALSKGKLKAGFSIFNTTTKRAETWTGTTWITWGGTSTSSSSSSSSSSSISTSTTIL